MSALSKYVLKLEERHMLPASVQHAIWNGWHVVSAFDGANSTYISESVSMGIDMNYDVAVFKALTEYCERKLSKNAPLYLTEVSTRSDGFAAYPLINIDDLDFKKMARENAFSEAVERFAWAEWWDDEEIYFTVSHDLPKLASRETDSLNALCNEYDIENISIIEVPIENSELKLLVLLAKINSFGYVTGGAAGTLNNTNVYSRAFGELFRHLIAFGRMKDSEDCNQRSFYEKRLYGFASGNWNSIVEKRISKKGTKKIILTELLLDNEFVHANSDLICIHRCFFQQARPFMGGSLERLCI